MLLCNDDLQTVRRGLKRLYLRKEVTPEAVTAALKAPGDPLKASRKASVKVVGEWVVKRSHGRFGTGLARHTFRRTRYRRAWLAAHRLGSYGVLVPEPIAYVEWGMGILWRNAFVTAHLDGCRNVEDFLRALIQRGGARDTLEGFLERLADAVNRLSGSGAYHADLSGKNIFTRDGQEFYFIDLDAVELDREYTDELRLKNHIQLYDSFCDELNDLLLVPFIERMLTHEHDLRVWMPAVRNGQKKRRDRIERKWAKQEKEPRR